MLSKLNEIEKKIEEFEDRKNVYVLSTDQDYELLQNNREQLEDISQNGENFSSHFFSVASKNSAVFELDEDPDFNEDEDEDDEEILGVIPVSWAQPDQILDFKLDLNVNDLYSQINFLRMLLDAFVEGSKSEPLKFVKKIGKINDYLPFIWDTYDESKGKEFNPEALFDILNFTKEKFVPFSSTKRYDLLNSLPYDKYSNFVTKSIMMLAEEAGSYLRDGDRYPIIQSANFDDFGDFEELIGPVYDNIESARNEFENGFRKFLTKRKFEEGWIQFKIKELEYYMNLTPERAVEHETDSSVLERVYQRVKFHDFAKEINGEEEGEYPKSEKVTTHPLLMKKELQRKKQRKDSYKKLAETLETFRIFVEFQRKLEIEAANDLTDSVLEGDFYLKKMEQWKISGKTQIL